MPFKNDARMSQPQKLFSLLSSQDVDSGSKLVRDVGAFTFPLAIAFGFTISSTTVAL